MLVLPRLGLLVFFYRYFGNSFYSVYANHQTKHLLKSVCSIETKLRFRVKVPVRRGFAASQ